MFGVPQLLITVIQKIAKTKKAFSLVAALVRIHLISILEYEATMPCLWAIQKKNYRRNYLVGQ